MKITKQRLKEIIKEELEEMKMPWSKAKVPEEKITPREAGRRKLMKWASNVIVSLEPLMELPATDTHTKHRDAVWNLLQAMASRGGTMTNLRPMPTYEAVIKREYEDE